ncbi:MAG: F0F1 ATP synthase subunit A [Ignavibacteriota bacterium]|jgi:F-type H+-transporting ATPase subunit a|nr:ATP synthase F0 subunit A [Ignavibacteriota bacterium]MCO6448884.1 F0F1 ATP synthase subunit A [Ignavibacterium album]MCZ2268776.1 F0F1 ATP synthase subunit A [Ignavibacteriales bacterium]MDX9710998.1 F0F1 ATP synthase subunit A [Ignavibacteriaceae bacterium]MEB2353613.1 F0F1 ATP synthase subunit A [Ignavibacteriales bacterium]
MIDSTTAVIPVDSVKTVHSESGSDWILHHVMDGNYLDFSPLGKVYLPHLQLFGLDISVTRHVVFMWLGAILLFIVMTRIAKAYKSSVIPKGFTNFWEVFILFVRDEIARPTIGKGFEKFLPYLLTVFFFILFGNFLGLIPFSATFTSNISVTATMAIFTFLVFVFGGVRSNGVFGYFKGLIPHGVPIFLLPIMAVVELLGLFTKPFALAIRLFANMTAGHIVIYALISLIFVMQSIGWAGLAIPLALFIYMLEILVALIQAYIFTMLSSLFIGMAVHQDH